MVSPDGSQPPVRLNAPLVPSGADVINYRYHPDTNQVLYTAPSQVAGQIQLHIVLGQPARSGYDPEWAAGFRRRCSVVRGDSRRRSRRLPGRPAGRRRR